MKVTTATLAAATKEIAERVGMSYCPGSNGFDQEVMRLAKSCMLDPSEVVNTPMFTAREITALLDDMVRNP